MRKTLLTLFIAATALGYTHRANAFKQVVTVANFSFSPASFSINAGDTVMWQWSNGAHTTTSLTIPATAATWDHAIDQSNTTFIYVPSATGTYNYKCTPHFSSGMTGSFTVSPCTNPATPAITPASGGSACLGSAVTLSTTAQSGASLQWLMNGTIISGATQTTYAASQAGSYSVQATNSCGSATSTGVLVTINPIPSAGFTFVRTSGKTYIFSPSTTAVGTTYLWNFGDGTPTSTLANPTHGYSVSGTYVVTLKVTASTGCNATTPQTIVTPTSVATIGRESFTISPNPASDRLQVHTDAVNALISLYDYTGRYVQDLHLLSRTANDAFYDVSSIPAGMYLMKITSGGGSATEKLLIAH